MPPFGVPLEVAMSAFLMGRFTAYLQLGAGAVGSILAFAKETNANSTKLYKDVQEHLNSSERRGKL